MGWIYVRKKRVTEANPAIILVMASGENTN